MSGAQDEQWLMIGARVRDALRSHSQPVDLSGTFVAVHVSARDLYVLDRCRFRCAWSLALGCARWGFSTAAAGTDRGEKHDKNVRLGFNARWLCCAS